MSSDRDRIRADLEAARGDFHAVLDALPESAWRAPSRNPAWTNAQLLFHVTLGFVLVPLLVRIMRLAHRAPPRAARAFARVLDAATPLFDRVNALGPRVGGRVLARAALARRLDRAIDAILRDLDRAHDGDWRMGMHYPARWDPRFRSYMTLDDLLRWSTAHCAHHLGQITGPTTTVREAS